MTTQANGPSRRERRLDSSNGRPRLENVYTIHERASKTSGAQPSTHLESDSSMPSSSLNATERMKDQPTSKSMEIRPVHATQTTWQSRRSFLSKRNPARNRSRQLSLVELDIGNLALELQRAHIHISLHGVSTTLSRELTDPTTKRGSTSVSSSVPQEPSHQTPEPPSQTVENSDHASYHCYEDYSTELNDARQTDLTPEDQAFEIYNERFRTSHIPDESASYPRFTDGELKLGPILGQGGFGTVYEIKDIELLHDSFKSLRSNTSSHKETTMRDDEEIDKEEVLNRHFIAKHCKRHNSKNRGDARYAMKCLRQEIQQDSERCTLGMVDMATELRVLSSTKHPNIVKLRAVASVSPFHSSFFLVLDRLYDTLEVRLSKWKKKEKRYKRWTGKLFFDRDGTKQDDLWDERLTATLDLAAAITHLHKQGIIHRDLKPLNIGFDIRDDIKIFDFGLAKEFRANSDGRDEAYNFTQMAGSPRYMANEVALGEPYNESCDTYSFALLLWQILTLKQPFGKNCTLDYLASNVWSGPKTRPAIEPSWSPSLQRILFEAWHPMWTARPKMKDIHRSLIAECMGNVIGGSSGTSITASSSEIQHSLEQRTNPVRRRSTFVFNRNSVSNHHLLASLGMVGSKHSLSSTNRTHDSKFSRPAPDSATFSIPE